MSGGGVKIRAAIVPCGGTGSRFGMDVPKQFAMLRDRPLFVHTLRNLAMIPEIDRIVLCMAATQMSEAERYLAEVTWRDRVTVVPLGGTHRHETIKQGLEFVGDFVKDDDFVLIHDAARPFPGQDLVRRLLDAAVLHGAAIAMRPCTSTIVGRGPDDTMDGVLPRASFVESHSPQVFQYGGLCRGYARYTSAELAMRTECAELFDGPVVKLVLADPFVFKVTYKTDLLLAQQLLPGGVALVTGGGRGIGRRIAELLAERGITVIVCARTHTEIADVAHRTGGRAIVCDVGDPLAVRRMFDEINASYGGRLDILVNNAGCMRAANILDTDDAALWQMFQTNAFGAFYCTREAIRMMSPGKPDGVRGGEGGVIITIGSSSTVGGRVGQTAYAMSKIAAQMLTESASLEVKSAGIACYNIIPKRTNTQMLRERQPVETPDELDVDEVATAACMPIFRFMLRTSGNSIHIR